jgi:HK97 family phage major capsid protein
MGIAPVNDLNERMIMESINEALERLLNERTKFVEEKVKPLSEIAATRSFTPEEETTSDECKKRLNAMDSTISLLRDEISTQSKMPQTTSRAQDNGISEQLRSLLVERNSTKQTIDLKTDLARAFKRSLTTDPSQPGAGSELVPTTFAQSLITPLRQMSGLLQAGAQPLSTSTGEEILWPRVKGYGEAEKNIKPGATIGGTDMSFDQVSSKTSKYGQIVMTPREIIEDSAIDIEGFVGQAIGQNVGLGIDSDALAALLPGDGKDNAITLKVTGGAITPTFDEIIDLESSVIAPYRVGAAFLVSPGAVKALRKIKDTTGRYLWQSSLQAGWPAVLDGYPVIEDPFLPNPGAGQATILFGSFNRVIMRVVNSLALERSDQFAFDKDSIAWRGILRAGVILTDSNALAAFVGKTA